MRRPGPARSGLQLSRGLYGQVVAPLLGDGSEVLGFDDEVSTDHDFGPRLQVFVATEADDAVPTFPGGIDQVVDSVEVLGHPERCRTAAGVLGLSEEPS